MIPRSLAQTIQTKALGFPIISILGPRQSGKTTLARYLFPKYDYVNLENPDSRQLAQNDPRGFFSRYSKYTIIDEAQRVPELFSYLQTIVDQAKINQQFILTGSQHFLLLDTIPQSLAGRMAIFNLNPLSNQELESLESNPNVWERLVNGYYPKFYDEKIDHSLWFSSYLQTYLEKDVRSLANITNLPLFERFIRLTAARTGTILNLLSLSNELDISHNTVKSWINLLEISGIIHLIQPYYANIGKRLVKTPKIYFVDVGFASWLIGIHTIEQLEHHPLKGALFETMIVGEIRKHIANQNLPWNLYFYRDHNGLEADALIDTGLSQTLIEIKSNQTMNVDYLRRLPEIAEILHLHDAKTMAIYAGSQSQSVNTGRLVGWNDVVHELG